MILTGALASALLVIGTTFMPTSTFAGTIVIATPSGESTVVSTKGAATHVTSNYSAQVNDIVAGPSEHIVVTPNGIHIADSKGQTATLTVINK